MTPKELGKKIKELIATAELDQAIQKLLDFFNDKEMFRALKNKVLFIKSSYSKAKKDESLGLSSAEARKLSYNKTSNQLLEIADELESGAFEKALEEKKKRRSRTGIGVAVGAALLIVLFLVSPFSPLRDKDRSPYRCPTFKMPNVSAGSPELYLKFALCPLQPVDRNGQIAGTVTGVHKLIRRNLLSKVETVGIDVGVELIGPDKFALDEKNYPLTFTNARQIGQGCDADLLVFGTTEDLGDQLIINHKFTFLTHGETFKLGKIQQAEESVNTTEATTTITTEGSFVDTVSSFTSISAGDEIIDELESVLLGIAAYYQGKKEESIELLSSVAPKDSATSLMRGMFLADAYLASNNNEKALAAYTEVLETHPNYGLAANNRAMLNYWANNWEEAIEDFNTRLEQAPTDTAALWYRGSAYLKAEMLDLAEKDLETATKLKQDQQIIQERRTLIREKVDAQELIRRNASQEIQRSPNNIKALKEIATANLKLGNNDLAVKDAKKAWDMNPNDTEALTTLLKAYYKAEDYEKLEATLRQAKSNGISVEDILPPQAMKRISTRVKQN